MPYLSAVKRLCHDFHKIPADAGKPWGIVLIARWGGLAAN